MNYGYFDDADREYIISTPRTPLPWINYLGSENFFSLISNTGGGYSFYRDAKLRRITRFRYNSVPQDAGGRCYYIKDGDLVWSPAFLPAKTLSDEYRCRHGMGYTVFESKYNDVSAELCCFVPLSENCEINRLVLKNTGNKKKTLNVYGMVEFCLWNAVDDSVNFQRNLSVGEVEIEEGVIYHKTEYRERRNHYAFYAANRMHDGFDTDRDSFLGRFNSFENPAAVSGGTSFNTVASGWSPIACHRYDLTLDAGEETSLIFMLGYAENEQKHKFVSKGVINKIEAKKMLSRFDTDEKVASSFAALKVHWQELMSKLYVDSGDKKFDRMVNIWNQYQCMVTFNLSRSASYFESGTGRGMGFRDSCQDLKGGIHLIPHERSRQRILDLAAIQFEDGSTYHQYQPLTKRGNDEAGRGFNDDPLWLIACTAAYIKETGDSSILFEPVPFNNVQGSEKPLFSHLRASVNYTINNKGPHGLPLIGRADWNDCMNLNCFSETPDESFQTGAFKETRVAESVFIAGMFVYYGKEYCELCRRFGDPAEAEAVSREIAAMESAVIKHGWDGEWFLRAYDAQGNKIGSHECDEGKIFIEPQGFCTMAGIGGREFGLKALESVKKYLVNDYGAEILYPPYSEYRKELGEMTSYPPGYKENGAVFCHNNPWVVIAAAKLGDGETAFDIYRRSLPTYLEEDSRTHRTEPYVYSQMIAGRSAPRYGEAKNSWLTGTASWMMAAASQAILGIKPDYDGLRIEPCLPAAIKRCRVMRKFRGATYDIEIINC
ncbi:MAG: hypothetical protein WDA65_09020, partial [Christensenellales bacterium]